MPLAGGMFTGPELNGNLLPGGSAGWQTVLPDVRFTEPKIRQWSGGGEDRYGKGLYAYAFADDGPLRLGAKKPEWEGWRSLAIGFAQAISNVDRHRIQERTDLRQYAIGVLGTASLLLVQVRKEHPETVAEAETA